MNKQLQASKRLTYVSVGIFWLISLGFVFVLGMFLAFTFHATPSNEQSQNNRSIDQRELLLLIERLNKESISAERIFEINNASNIEPWLETTAINLILWKDPQERAHFIEILSRDLPFAKVIQLIQYIESRPESPASRLILSSLFNRWATEDPRSSLTYVLNDVQPIDREAHLNSILKGWASVNSEDAWAWVELQKIPNRFKVSMYRGILEQKSIEDIEMALSMISRHQEFPYTEELTYTFFQYLAENYPLNKIRSTVLMLPEALQYEAILALGENWAEDDVSQAINWMFNSGIESIDLRPTIERFGLFSPKRAADWVLGKISPEERSLLIEDVAIIWIESGGVVELAKWINEKGDSPDLDGARRQLSLNAVNSNPVTAMQWAQSISDPEDRSLAEILVGKSWIEQNPEEAFPELEKLLPAGPSWDYFFKEEYDLSDEEI